MTERDIDLKKQHLEDYEAPYDGHNVHPGGSNTIHQIRIRSNRSNLRRTLKGWAAEINWQKRVT